MSHFVTFVLTKSGEEDEAEELLAPFSEQDDDYLEFVDQTEKLSAEFEDKEFFNNSYCQEKHPTWVGKTPKTVYKTLSNFANDWYCWLLDDGRIGYYSNPNAKWDWYECGGRYDGFIHNNRTKVSTLLKKKSMTVPFAILEPDGTWNERGEMGWFACVSDEKGKEDWEQECKEILARNEECYALCYDLHI